MPASPVPFGERVHPELRELFSQLPALTLRGLDDIVPARAGLAALYVEQPMPPSITVTDRLATSSDGHDITVREYRPIHAASPAAAYVWIHGGGYVIGGIDRDDARCAQIAHTLGIVVFSVDYRVAPEHPYPLPLDDCWAGHRMVVDHADRFGLDPSRIALGGASAGGGLAAALCLRIRDDGSPPPCLQVLHFPMLDDRVGLGDDEHDTHASTWNLVSNRVGWQAYLGDAAGSDDVTPLMAPSRATDLSGLPPTYLTTSDVDLFAAENLAYARLLIEGGVSTELRMYPGMFHGAAGLAPQSAIARAWRNDAADVLRHHLRLI